MAPRAGTWSLPTAMPSGRRPRSGTRRIGRTRRAPSIPVRETLRGETRSCPRWEKNMLPLSPVRDPRAVVVPFPADEQFHEPAKALRASGRVLPCGKFFQLDGQKWYLKGFTYGPFAPDGDNLYLPARHRVRSDFAQIRALGSNCIRVYHRPPSWLLDEAIEHELRVLVDVPWEKHRCFFEDWSAQESAREEVRRTARELGGHPGLFAIS